jgi:hypothetical protein
LVEVIGEALVGPIHPFVVSPKTTQQANAVLSACAYHRVGLSVVNEPPESGATIGSDDVDVVLLLGPLFGGFAPP